MGNNIRFVSDMKKDDKEYTVWSGYFIDFSIQRIRCGTFKKIKKIKKSRLYLYKNILFRSNKIVYNMILI
jgi:hypothetical protein